MLALAVLRPSCGSQTFLPLGRLCLVFDFAPRRLNVASLRRLLAAAVVLKAAVLL